MNPHSDSETVIEAERYELFEGPAYRFELDRREFLRALGGGILVFSLLGEASAQRPGGGRGRGGQPAPREIGAWLHIGEDGQVSVFTGKAEVGQNIRTSLTQAVAEELHAPTSSIRLVMADTQLTPFDMGTFGSRTTPDMARQLHRMAAAARELLIDLAAEHWKADRAALAAADGAITREGSGDRLDYGTLTRGKKLTKAVEDDPPTTPADQWKIAGHSEPKVDGRDFVTGRHRFTSDLKRPGMWYGKVLRPTSFGASLASLDAKGAESGKDVVVVRDGDFVGVAAPGEIEANRALQALKADWKAGPSISSKDLFDDLKRQGREARSGRGGSAQEVGSMEEGLGSSDVRLEATYTVAYIAHTPLEPRAALAEWDGGKLTVWTGTQRPFGVRGELASAFKIPESDIRVIVPDTGAGYGGKHTGEAAVEAARIARAAGRPVKLVWTREEEFTWAYFRPAGLIEIASGARADGTLMAWEFHNVNSGGSGIRTPYEVPNQRIAFHAVKSPLRQGSYRALAATANHFARESHMDELAHALHMDPLEFRLKNLKDERLLDVLKAAAEAFGWDRKLGADRGAGLAVGTEKGGFIATCAEVAVDRSSGRLKVVRAVSAFECGAIVNPDHLKNQVEGAMVMGLGGALSEAIEYAEGRIANASLNKYRVPRFADAPSIEVVLLDRKDRPSAGAGETPIVGIAPAVGNAIFAATGDRLRGLPMAPRGVVNGTEKS